MKSSTTMTRKGTQTHHIVMSWSQIIACTIFTLASISLTSCQTNTLELGVCSDICNRQDFYYVDYNDCLYACSDVIDQLAADNDIPQGDYADDMSDSNTLPEAADMNKRKSSFVRIGRQKSSFVRIGRSADGEAVKRPSSFVRIGKSDPEYIDSELRDVSDVGDVSKRASSFVRIGKSSSDPRFIYKRPSSFVRIGKKSDEAMDAMENAEKRKSSFVRIGKSMPAAAEIDNEKRASSFVRIGRPSSFVRIGKKDNGGKRVSSFVRIGKKDEYDSEADALNSQLQDELYNEQAAKRASSFVRIGKSYDDETPKRASSFVRIGKSYGGDDQLTSDQLSQHADKRASSFVRIGKASPFGSKRMSNFVRIGKRSVDSDENQDGGQSSL